MCGLAGYVSKKEFSREAQDRFVNILISAEARGTDACGVGFIQEKNRFYYAKAPKKASEFVQEKGFQKLIANNNPTILIGHNRAKTQGDQANNMNNHPLVTKTGLMLIHNGVLSNEDEIAKEFKLSLDAEVDSEVILKLIEYYVYAQKKPTIKAIQLMAKHIRGSMAIALLNDKEPQSLYLLASSNPINLAYHIPTKTIYFASTEDILRDGLITYDGYFNGLFYKARSKEEYVFKELDDNTGLKITPKSWEDFEVERPTYQTSYQGGAYQGRDYDEDENYNYGYRNRPKTFEPSTKPVIVEAKGEEDIIKALKECKDFDPRDIIEKPSKYMSEFLLYRLEMIQEDFTTGDYLIWYQDPNTDGTEFTTLRNEVRRIIDTLGDRQKKTKRTDIVIPTFEDVFLVENEKYEESLAKGQPDADGFKDLKWILTHANPKAMELLSKAEKYGKNEDKELTAEQEDIKDSIENAENKDKKKDIDTADYFTCVECKAKVYEDPCPYCGQYTEPAWLGEEGNLDYYCPKCYTLKNRNICIECGEINLKSADAYFNNEKEKQLALVN